MQGSTLFQSLSIKTKLYFIIGTLVTGVLAYAAYQQHSFQRLGEVENAAKQNQASEIELLTLRRHEKDFLARKDPKYIERFDTTFRSLSARIASLNQYLSQYQTSKSGQLETIEQTLSTYQSQFHALADLVVEIGGNETQGLKGEQTQAREVLKEGVVRKADNDIKVAYLQLVEADFHYLAEPTPEILADFNAYAQELSSLVAGDPQLLALHLDYIERSNTLFAAFDSLGLSPTQGMLGVLRDNVHATEAAIKSLQDQIQIVIDEVSGQITRQLYMIGAVIAGLVSFLLLVVAKSITVRIGQITALMEDISRGEGDLTVRMNAQGSDELAQLANAFDLFISKLHDNIRDIAQVMNVLKSSSELCEQSSRESMGNATSKRWNRNQLPQRLMS